MAGAAIGLLGLIAWIAGRHELTSILADQPRMQPNTALSLFLLGMAGALRSGKDAGSVPRAVSSLLALAVLTIGLGSLAEYVQGTDLHIDRILQKVFVNRELFGPYPGRPSPPTAFALALLSIAVLIFDYRSRARARPSEWLVSCAIFTAFTALVGVAYGAGPLYRLPDAPVTGVAMTTAVALLLISVGLLFERPETGAMRLVTSTRPGGIMLRRLALPVVLAALVIGPAVMRMLIALGLRDIPLIAATLTIVMAALSVLLLAIAAKPLNRTHDVLESSRSRIRELLEHAPEGIFIADRDGRLIDVNNAGCRMLVSSREEILARTVFDFIPAEESDRLKHEREEMLKGRAVVSEWRLRRPDGSYLPTEVSACILADGRWQGFARDISERKLAEEQLHESRTRLELALRGADLATWDWNVRTGEVTFNSRWAEMRGLRPEEIAPHVDSWISGVHPEDLPRVKEVLQEHLDGKTSEYEAELRVRTESGEWLWILDRGKVFARDEAGRPVRMAGTELDITNQKRLEEQLRLSLAQASGILSISADAIISMDEDQRITMFNDGAEKIFGCRKDEAIRGPLERWIPERFRAIHRQHVEAFARDGQVARRMGGPGRTVFALRQDGSEFPADATISKLDIAGRKVLTIALRDITEQKRIEREKRLLADFASALASTLDFEETLSNIAQAAARELADICVVETMDETGRLPRARAAHRDPGKQEAAEVLRRHPLDVWHTRLGSSVISSREPLVISEITAAFLESLAVDAKHLRALRSLEMASLIALPLQRHGRILGSMVLLGTSASCRFDASVLPLAQEVARRAAEALAHALLYRTALHATQSRDVMLGIVAHDLRNPLNAISLEAAVLRRLADARKSEMAEGIEMISRAVGRMSRLVDDLLDLTLVESGHLSLQLARIAIAELIADCIPPQTKLAGAASLELCLELEKDLPDVRADRHRVLQVLENLIGNAIKFTEAGGRITVGAARHEDEVHFRVTNSGTGIPPEQLPHLFDRFWQARENKRGGAGLGLAIVKGIVEAHGGRVWAQSTPGRESTFIFTIPVAADPVPLPQDARRLIRTC